jgi:hypothetical protein
LRPGKQFQEINELNRERAMVMGLHTRGSSHTRTLSALPSRSLYAPGGKAVLLQAREEINADFPWAVVQIASRDIEMTEAVSRFSIRHGLALTTPTGVRLPNHIFRTV